MTIAPVEVEDLRKRVSISVSEAAALIGISRAHAYDLNAEGRLPGAYPMGGRILVHVPTLLAGIEAMATQSSPPVAGPSRSADGVHSGAAPATVDPATGGEPA